MIRDHRNAVLLALVVCVISPSTVLAKKHHNSHKSKTKTKTNASAGTLTLSTNSYQGLTTISTELIALAPPSYDGLILNFGNDASSVSSGATLTLSDWYPSFQTISYGGTVLVANTVGQQSYGTLVSNSTQLFAGSAGTLSIELNTSSSSMGTLDINPVKYFGDLNLTALQQSMTGLTLSANAYLAIPSISAVETSGTFTPTVPEPTSLGLAAIAALAFLRRPSRK